MPRLTNQPPKMRHDKANGNAVVSVNGKKKYLGRWGSDQAREKYNRFLEAWIASSGLLPDSPEKNPVVADLVTAFLLHAKEVCGTGDFSNYRAAAKRLLLFYGTTPVTQFGPKALSVVRNQFVKDGYSRGHCNKLTNFIRTIFRWGVAQELVPETVANALKYVRPLEKGRTTAPDPSSVKTCRTKLSSVR